MNEATKFVWAYLLENGYETTGKWSYYGSCWESIPGREWNSNYKEELLNKVKTVGVDWEKTNEPVSSVEYGFDGTFVESSTAETLLGKLVLKDGSSYFLGCEDADNMGSYINNLKKLMNDRDRVSRILGE